MTSLRRKLKRSTAARENATRELADARGALAQTRSSNASESERVARALLEQCTRDAAGLAATLKTAKKIGDLLRRAEAACSTQSAKLFTSGVSAAVDANAIGLDAATGGDTGVRESASHMPDWQVSRLSSYEQLVANGLAAARPTSAGDRPRGGGHPRTAGLRAVPPPSATADAAERARRMVEREVRTLKQLRETHALHVGELQDLAERARGDLKAERELIAELVRSMRDGDFDAFDADEPAATAAYAV